MLKIYQIKFRVNGILNSSMSNVDLALLTEDIADLLNIDHFDAAKMNLIDYWVVSTQYAIDVVNQRMIQQYALEIISPQINFTAWLDEIEEKLNALYLKVDKKFKLANLDLKIAFGNALKTGSIDINDILNQPSKEVAGSAEMQAELKKLTIDIEKFDRLKLGLRAINFAREHYHQRNAAIPSSCAMTARKLKQ